MLNCKRAVLFLSVVGSFGGALPCRAGPVPILGIDPVGGLVEPHHDGTVGWYFQLTQPVTVLQVGWYDDGGDGLSRPFEVGLWQLLGYDAQWQPIYAQILGNPQTGLFIPGGTSAPLVGSWRVQDLPQPLQLPVGNYILAGVDTQTTTDPVSYKQCSPNQSAQLSQNRLVVGSDCSGPGGFAVPNFFDLASGLDMGPMLMIDVPEISSGPLLLMGIAGIVGCSAFKRKCQRFGRAQGNV